MPFTMKNPQTGQIFSTEDTTTNTTTNNTGSTFTMKNPQTGMTFGNGPVVQDNPSPFRPEYNDTQQSVINGVSGFISKLIGGENQANAPKEETTMTPAKTEYNPTQQSVVNGVQNFVSQLGVGKTGNNAALEEESSAHQAPVVRRNQGLELPTPQRVQTVDDTKAPGIFQSDSSVVTDEYKKAGWDRARNIFSTNQDGTIRGGINAAGSALGELLRSARLTSESEEAAKMGMTVPEWKRYDANLRLLGALTQNAQAEQTTLDDLRAGLDVIQGKINDLTRSNYGAGNINLSNLPRFDNGDGTYSYTPTVSFRDEKSGLVLLIPAIEQTGENAWRSLTEEEAIEQYRATGKYLGAFENDVAAQTYANELQRQQEEHYGDWAKLSAEYKAAEETYNAAVEKYQNGIYKDLQKTNSDFLLRYDPVSYYEQKFGDNSSLEQIDLVILGSKLRMENLPSGSDEYNDAKRRYEALVANRMRFASDEELQEIYDKKYEAPDTDDPDIQMLPMGAFGALVPYNTKTQKIVTGSEDRVAAGQEIQRRDAINTTEFAKGTSAELYLNAIAEYAATGTLSPEMEKALFEGVDPKRAKKIQDEMDPLEYAKLEAWTRLEKMGVGKREIQNTIDALEREGNRRKVEAGMQDLSQFTTKNQATELLTTAFSVITNAGSGMGLLAVADNLLRGGTNRTLDPYSEYFTLTNATNTMRGAINEKYNDTVDLGVLGTVDLADVSYGLVTSTLDTVLAGGYGGERLAGAVLGMSAGAQAALEVAQNGGSVFDSFVTGLAASVFEGLFETVSIGQLKRFQEAKLGADSVFDILTTPEMRKIFFSNLRKAGVTNFSEEAATELANILFDRIKSSGTSITNYKLALADYLEQGYSEDQAKTRVFVDQAMQVIGAGISGAIQGVVMSGVIMASSARQVNAVRKYVKNLSKTQETRIDMLVIGNTLDGDSDVKQYSAKKLTELNNVLESDLSAEEKSRRTVDILNTVENDADWFDSTLADELEEHAPEGFNTPEVIDAALNNLLNGSTTPPHIETATETKIRETQQAVGMSQADSAATSKLLFQLVNGETNLQTRGIGAEVLKSDSFRNAVQQLTGMELKGNDTKSINKSLNEIAKTIRDSDVIDLNPAPAPETEQTNLVQPTETQAAPADGLNRGGWYNQTAEQAAFMKDVMGRVAGSTTAATQQTEATGAPAQQTQPAQTQPAQTQQVHKRGDKIRFSAAETTENGAGKLTQLQQMAEKIYNVLLSDSGVKVRVVSGDPALVGATGMHNPGEITINADQREYVNPVTGERRNIDATSFAGMSWVLGHELYHEYATRTGGEAALKRVQGLMKALAKDGVLTGRYAEIAKSDKAWDKLRNEYRPRWVPLILNEVKSKYGDQLTDAQAIAMATEIADRDYVDAEIAGDFLGSIFGFNAGNAQKGLFTPGVNRTQALISLANIDRGVVQDTADRVSDAVEAADEAGHDNAEVGNLRDFLLDLGTALYATRKDSQNTGSQYSAAEFFDMPYNEQLAMACKGDIDYNDSLAVAKESPKLFDKIGFPKGPIVFPQSKFFLAMSAHEETMYEPGGLKDNGVPAEDVEVHWHTVPYKTMVNIANRIKNPAMVYKYHNDNADVDVRNSMIVVTTDLDRNGYPIVVAVRPSEWVTVGGEKIKANMIVTAFGMQNFFNDSETGDPSKLQVIKDNDLLLSINKEKYRELTQKYEERFPGLQTPDADLPLQALSTLGTNVIIRKWNWNVNPYNGNGASYSSYSAADDGMYSPLENFVGDLQTDKNGNLNAQHIMGQIKGNKGAMDEAKSIGLADYLDGRQTISKSELSQYIRDNAFKLVEDRRESGPEFWAIKNNETGEIYGSAADLSADAKVIATNRGLRYDGYKVTGGDNGLINLSTGAIKQTYVAYGTDAAGNQIELFRADSTKIGSGGTKFNDVTLMGGSNYTEQLYVAPNSGYTNAAMRKHWGDTKGVLMHVRTKDFRTSNNAKVLLVEEMQSDWHNTGSKDGYESNGGTTPDAPYRNSYTRYLFNRMLMRAVDEDYDMVAWTNSNSQMYRGNPYFERNEKGNIRGLRGYINEYDRDLPNLASKYGDVETILLPKASQFVTPKRYMDLMRQYSETEAQLNQLNESMRNQNAESTESMVQQGDQLRALSDKLTDLSKQMADIRNSGEMEEQHGVTVQGIRVTDDLMDKVWDGLPRFSAADTGRDGMYSALEREINSMQTNKKGEFNAKTLLRTLQNRTQKVRGLSEEIKWSKLGEFLSNYEGENVPKSDVLAWIRNETPVLDERLRESSIVSPGSDGQYAPYDVDGNLLYGEDSLEDALYVALANKLGSLYEDMSEEEGDMVSEDYVIDSMEYEFSDDALGDPIINPMTGEVAQVVTGYMTNAETGEVVPVRVLDWGSSPRDPGEVDETKFRYYSLNGGDDYKEHVFKLPGATYGGTAEESHWDEPGVLLHVREQTMHTPDGKKVLFIEEVQSDWHNDATKKGYESKGGEVPDAPYAKTYTEYALRRMLMKAAEEGYDYVAWTTPAMQMDRWNPWRIGNDLQANSDNPRYLRGYTSTYGRDLVNAANRVSAVVDVPLADASSKTYESEAYHKAMVKAELAYDKYAALSNKGRQLISDMEDSGIDPYGTPEYEELDQAVDNAWQEYDDAREDFWNANGARTYGGEPVESAPGIEITPELREKILSEGFPRFSVAGPNSATADEALLKDAKRYEREGWSMQDIFDTTTANLPRGSKSTGWWKDSINKWQYEISDDKARFIPSADERVSKNDENYKDLKDAYLKLRKKFNRNQLRGEKLKQYEALKEALVAQREKITNEFKQSGGVLGDILRHEELYNAYPDLEDMPVKVRDIPKGKNGEVTWAYYDPSTDSLTLNRRLFTDTGIDADKKLKVVLHETQHAIQKREGWDPGTNIDDVEKARKTADERLSRVGTAYTNSVKSSPRAMQAAEEIVQALRSGIGWGRRWFRAHIPGDDTLTVLSNVGDKGTVAINSFKKEDAKAAIQTYVDGLIAAGYADENDRALLMDDARLDAMIEAANQLRYVATVDNNSATPGEVYQAVRGEQEARATADRLTMNTTERRQNRLILPEGPATKTVKKLNAAGGWNTQAPSNNTFLSSVIGRMQGRYSAADDSQYRVDFGAEKWDNLSEEAKNIVRRVDAGDTFTVEDYFRIPEVQRAQEESSTPINYNPGERERIINNAYEALHARGSYSGRDSNNKPTYNGPIGHDKRIDIVMGLPGSGKSSVYTDRISQQFGSRIIDTDDAREYNPYYNGYNSGAVHREASATKKLLMQQALLDDENILLSTIGDDLEKMREDIKNYNDLGYSVHLHLNELPNEKSMARAVVRMLKENRYVPLPLIQAFGNKPTENYLILTGQKGAYDARREQAGQSVSDVLRGGIGVPGRDQSNAAGYGSGAEGEAGSAADLLAGYDWYNNDVEKGKPARLISDYSTDTGIGPKTGNTDQQLTDVLNRMQEGQRYSAADTTEVGNPTDYQDWYQSKAQTDRQPISAEQLNNTQGYRAEREAINIPYTGTKKGYVTDRNAQTIANAGITPDAAVESIKSSIANGAYQHMTYSDTSAYNKASKEIERNGWRETFGKYQADVLAGKASKDITAMGIALYNNAVTAGNMYDAMDIASLMIKNASSVGAALQANRMLSKVTPDGRLYMAVRSIENIAEELRGIYGDEYGIDLDYGLIEDYRNALVSGTEAQQKEAWKAIEQSIADQIPSDWKLKLNNWRYMAMLGNPRTHIRNIVGNLGFMPVRLAKQGLKAVMERMFQGKAGEGSNRTTALLNPFSSEDKARRQAARDDYDNVVDLIQSGGKMTSTKGEIENLRTVYNTKFLEWFRQRNGDWLDREDTWFSRPAYAEALASFLKARGIDGDAFAAGNVSPDLLNRAREHAILEAQKATYRDSNQFSDWVSSLGKAGRQKNASKVQKLASGAVEAVLPFKKTPANILVRAVEYSPAEFAQVFFGDIKKIRQAQKATQDAEAKSDGSAQALREIAKLKENESLAVSGMLDHIASGLTGTVLLGLGALLRNMGFISGGKDPDKEQAAFDELHGTQEYSINIGGVNYTIDWLAPEALPLFTGVTLFDKIKQMRNKDEDDESDLLSDVWNLVVGLGEPMLNMSMLSSVNDLVSKMTYLDDATQLPALLGQIGYSYVSQYIPTLFGQVERVTENRRESTYYDRDDKLSKDLQYALGKTANKIPVWDYNQIPYLDAWGREQQTGEIGGDIAEGLFGEGARGVGSVLGRVISNMVSPGYTRKRNGSELDDELQRLHDLGFDKVLPERTTQSTKVDQEYMNEQEYVAYARLRGQTALADLTALTNSKSYQNMTDEQKADAVSRVFSDAKKLAEDAVREIRGDAVKGTNATKANMDAAAFSAAKTVYDTAEIPSWFSSVKGNEDKEPGWAKALAVLDDSSLSKSDRLKFINAASNRKDEFKTYDEAKAYYTEARDEAKLEIKYAPAKDVYDNATTPSGYKKTDAGNTPGWAKMLALLDSKGISDSLKLEYINSVSGRKEPYKSLDEAREYYEGKKADAKIK